MERYRPELIPTEIASRFDVGQPRGLGSNRAVVKEPIIMGRIRTGKYRLKSENPEEAAAMSLLLDNAITSTLSHNNEFSFVVTDEENADRLKAQIEQTTSE